jgi:flagellar protein FlaG
LRHLGFAFACHRANSLAVGAMRVFVFIVFSTFGVYAMLIPSASSAPAVALSVAAAATTAEPSKPTPPPAPAPQASQASAPDPQVVKKAVAALNQSLEQGPTSVRFQLDESSGKTVVTLVDTEKNSVLLQFPNNNVLSLSGTLPLTQGSIINTKA